MDYGADQMYGWHTAHRIGDLIRVIKVNKIDLLNKKGDIGIVLGCPAEKENGLFVEVYMIKSGQLRWFAPSEIDIISNIDE